MACIVHGSQSRTQLSDFHFSAFVISVWYAVSPQGPTGACVTLALAAEALVIPCRRTGGGVSLLSGLLEAWPSWRMPTRVLRTLWWLGPPLQVLGPTGAPPCFSEEVGVGALPCSWPPTGFFFPQMGLEREFAWGSSPVCIPISSLSSWLASSVLKINSSLCC